MLVALFFFFVKETVVVEYRKTNGELGREELSFQLGEMEGIQLKQCVCFLFLSFGEPALSSWS